MKENQIRELVNELRDIAIEYHGTQQLRERIARTVRAAIIQAGNSTATPDERTAFDEWNNGEDCPLAGRDAKSAAWLAWIHRAKLGVTPAPVQVDIEMLASALKNAPLAPSDNHGRPRAPVVPPAIEPDYKVIKSILPTANPDEYACCIAADMWNACRTAMLHGGENSKSLHAVKAAPVLNYSVKNIDLLHADCRGKSDGNSPVIPCGWISCSERMPGREYVLAGDFSGTHYLASIPNVQVGIYADWFDDEKPCWDDGDGNDLHLKEVTHWMPLPEPPQEVK